MKNAKLNKIWQNLKQFYTNNKKFFFLILACVIVVLVIFFSSIKNMFSSKTDSSDSKKSSTVSVSSYQSMVEEKISSMLSLLDEIKFVSIYVAVDGTPEVKYLSEETKTENKNDSVLTSTTSTTVVFEKNGSVSTPVVVTTIYPKITGVLIVTNSISAMTKNSIINSISVVLNVDESCISILQGN